MREKRLLGEDPSLREAWKYFYHNTLPRRVPVAKDGSPAGNEPGTDATDRIQYRRAGDHELSSELYPILGTSLADLGQFGLGFGLYFRQLLALAVLCTVYALISLPTLIYFTDSEYDPKGYSRVMFSASASCSSEESVEVADCDGGDCTGRYVTACKLKFELGILDFVALAVMFALFMAVFLRQDNKMVHMDESVQTAQDYSVVVIDPTPDATDPDEWEEFFSQFGPVAYVTVAKNNGQLLRLLTERREVLHQLRLLHAHEMPAEDYQIPVGEMWKIPFQLLGFMCDDVYWLRKLAKLEQEIGAELTSKQFRASKVYVTFETERAQRKCLKRLTTGLIPAITDTSYLATDRRFREQNVLQVFEASEPSEVIWDHLELSPWYRLFQQSMSAVVTTGFVIGAYFAILYAKEEQNFVAGITVSVINSALPVILRWITYLEKHIDQGDREDSLMFKLVAARFMNTAIINYVTTGFSRTLDSESIAAIESILVIDAILTPLLNLADLPGLWNRLVLARFAKTQDKMNTYFQGTEVSLGERYTSMSKTLFVALFYAALYPPGMFIAAFTYLLTFWVDKLCLLRVWRAPPLYDAQVAKKSRGYLLLSVLAHLLVTANWYAGWPFDDVVKNHGDFELVNKNAYEDGYWNFFWPQSTWWMDNDQRRLVDMYGLAALIVFVILSTTYFGWEAYYSIRSLFFGKYEIIGDDQGIPFSDVPNISAYVPRGVRSSDKMVGSLLATDLRSIDQRHLGGMRSRDVDDHNVFHDVPEGFRSVVFGTIKRYGVASSSSPSAVYGAVGGV